MLCVGELVALEKDGLGFCGRWCTNQQCKKEQKCENQQNKDE